MKADTEPHISIIIVNYNGAGDTIECIDSLGELEYANFDVVIVNNGSTDNSLTVLKDNESKYDLLFNDENYGYPAGVNTGIEKAIENGSDYILLLNNDTIIPKGNLSLLVETLEKDDHATAATGIIRYMSDNSIQYAGGSFNKPLGKMKWKTEIQHEDTYETEGLLGAFILVRTEFMAEVGGLDEQFFFGHDDIDLSYEILKKGGKMVVNPNVTIYHEGRGSAGDLTEFLSYYSTRNQLYFIRKHLSVPHNIIPWLYLLISRVVLLVKKADFMGSRIGFLRATKMAIVDELRNNKLKRPKSFK